MSKITLLSDICNYKNIPPPASEGFSNARQSTPSTAIRPIYSKYTGKKGKNVKGLDTLAQSATARFANGENTYFQLDENHQKNLAKRAQRQYLRNGMVLGLVRAAEQNQNSDLKKQYWNSWHCSAVLVGYEDGSVEGKYCKNRWCSVCNAIRTAELIKTYEDTINAWDDKRFVTLTRRNVTGEDLRETIADMIKTCGQIGRKIKKRYERGKGDKFVAVRRLECTYNPETNRYHPHLHFIIEGYENAEELRQSWIKKHEGVIYENSVAVLPELQKNDVADENCCIEIFKYFTKLITKGKDSDGNEHQKIYADAMDVIFNSIKGRRTFQPIGFRAPKLEEPEPKKETDPLAIYTWEQEVGDWIDKTTGDLLTGHTPSDWAKDMVENKIVVRSFFAQKRKIVIGNNPVVHIDPELSLRIDKRTLGLNYRRIVAAKKAKYKRERERKKRQVQINFSKSHFQT